MNKRIVVLLLAIAISVQPVMGSSYVVEKLRDLLSKFDTTLSRAYRNIQGSFTGRTILDFISEYGGTALTGLILGKTMVSMQQNMAQNLLTHSLKPVIVTDTTLEDYIGVPSEVKILVDQIKNRQAYIDLKAPFTKGILLTGNPGTGKSFLAKAIAGEAQVPFFSVSATDFNQPYMGMSGVMIRDLFKNAKLAALNSPAKLAIIFIDELEAIGGRGSASMTGTPTGIVQQLLIEMDGFNKISAKDLDLPWYKTVSAYVKGTTIDFPEIQVVVLAATNVPENLDPAIKRPGRFDNTIQIMNPAGENRKKIIDSYFDSKKHPISNDVEASRLAIVMDGMTPAEIKAVFAEAARNAGFKKQPELKIKNFAEALFDFKSGKQIGNYEQRVLEILINLYPCDETVTVNSVVAANIGYENVQQIADIFENAYLILKMKQAIVAAEREEQGEKQPTLISLKDLTGSEDQKMLKEDEFGPDIIEGS